MEQTGDSKPAWRPGDLSLGVRFDIVECRSLRQPNRLLQISSSHMTSCLVSYGMRNLPSLVLSESLSSYSSAFCFARTCSILRSLISTRFSPLLL